MKSQKKKKRTKIGRTKSSRLENLTSLFLLICEWGFDGESSRVFPQTVPSPYQEERTFILYAEGHYSTIAP
jgi:hypothetical protein